MAKGGFQGYGAGANMNNLLKQAQKIQQQMEEAKKDIENKEFEATVGGGVVTAVVKGSKQLVDIKIKPEVVDQDDIETLQDLIITAVNEAIKKAEDEAQGQMSKLTGGVNIPGMF
ncbi:MAG: YbaB/EbfC family nucleoid-associated protein [Bacillota bacterium]|nr:YbaB/EbfC family nucleoid-associated protein [Bacillota bacterium]